MLVKNHSVVSHSLFKVITLARPNSSRAWLQAATPAAGNGGSPGRRLDHKHSPKLRY